MTDYKRLCAELLQAWDNAPTPSDFIDTEGYGFFAKIRAALAEPEPEGPSDEDLAETVRQSMEDCIFVSELLYYTREPLMQILRAVLARWGNHPGSPDSSGNLKAGLTRSPAASEVAELPPRPSLPEPTARPEIVRYGVTWDGSSDKPLLTPMADGYWTPWHIAANLLERLTPQPVPVSERLPGPGDCDAEGKCWWFDIDGQWYFRSKIEINIAGLRRPLHWLPAHALPLPS